jgi:hypothetical protein
MGCHITTPHGKCKKCKCFRVWHINDTPLEWCLCEKRLNKEIVDNALKNMEIEHGTVSGT